MIVSPVPPSRHPTDATTGLILPLSKSLDSRALAAHRAMVGVELEVLAKKFDRFGWERDRGSAAHDRLMMDWMDALADYPLDEIRAACRAAILANPNRMPNEGHVVAMILDARRSHVANMAQRAPSAADDPSRVPCSPDAAARIMAEVYGPGADAASIPAAVGEALRVARSGEL